MLNKILVLALLANVCSGSAIGTEAAAEKLAMLKQLDQVNRTLVNLAEQCSKRGCDSGGSLDEKLVGDRVKDIIESTSDPDVLLRLAVVSYMSAYPQTAGVQRVDLVFDAAWTASINKLSSLGTPKALEALKTIDHLLQTDAGDSLTLRSAIDRAERSTKPQ